MATVVEKFKEKLHLGRPSSKAGSEEARIRADDHEQHLHKGDIKARPRTMHASVQVKGEVEDEAGHNHKMKEEVLPDEAGHPIVEERSHPPENEPPFAPATGVTKPPEVPIPPEDRGLHTDHHPVEEKLHPAQSQVSSAADRDEAEKEHRRLFPHLLKREHVRVKGEVEGKHRERIKLKEDIKLDAAGNPIPTEQEPVTRPSTGTEPLPEAPRGPVCDRKFVSTVEDRLVEKEIIETVIEHHPVAKEYVVETRPLGERELVEAVEVERLGVREEIIAAAAGKSPCEGRPELVPQPGLAASGARATGPDIAPATSAPPPSSSVPGARGPGTFSAVSAPPPPQASAAGAH